MEEKARPLSPVRGSGKANRIAAFVSLQRIPELEGRRVSPPFPDHRTAPPQAGQFTPLYTLACGPVFGAKLKDEGVITYLLNGITVYSLHHIRDVYFFPETQRF